MSPPAIVVAAHNRPIALRRLLDSVRCAEIAKGTTLVISIDGGAPLHEQVRRQADEVVWPHGPLRIMEHDTIGLVEHWHRCGELTHEYESVVLLEDDLVVGPAFHRWATAALAHASTDDRIAGVSLATPFFDGYRHLPFEPLLDGSDALFAQVPWYDGMAWTAPMWHRFADHDRPGPQDAPPLHESLATLGSDEWFGDAMRYLRATGRFYLLPRDAHATNTGAPGSHFTDSTDYFQVPLTLRGPSHWRMHSLDESLAVYDDHMELQADRLKRLVPDLVDYELTVDLLGVRDLASIASTHVITTRSTRSPIRLWGASMHPLVANLVHNVPGDAIRLARTADVGQSTASDAVALATLTRHADRGRTLGSRDAMQQIVANVRSKLTRG